MSSLVATTVLVARCFALSGAERDAPDASITTFGDAMWWALTPITTVRYEGRYTVTWEGRLVGAVLMVVGIAATAMVVR